VIGDVIGSRGALDRRDLQSSLQEALQQATTGTGVVQTFSMTIGDEFQGIFERVSDATRATLMLQLIVTDRIGLRFGIGEGEIVAMGSRAPFEQDGEAWWRAREAIERVKNAERSKGTPRHWSTGIVTGDGSTGSIEQGYLILRDHIVAGFDRVDADIALGLLEARTQASIADELGIDKGSISRRIGRNGVAAVIASVAGPTVGGGHG
jgi:hypothetical protein